MGKWIKFFLGTPRRFAYSSVGVGLVIVSIQPGLLAVALQRLVVEVQPLLGPVLAFVIVYAGFRLIFSGRK